MVRTTTGSWKKFCCRVLNNLVRVPENRKGRKGKKRGERANYRFALAGQKQDKCTLDWNDGIDGLLKMLVVDIINTFLEVSSQTRRYVGNLS